VLFIQIRTATHRIFVRQSDPDPNLKPDPNLAHTQLGSVYVVSLCYTHTPHMAYIYEQRKTSVALF